MRPLKPAIWAGVLLAQIVLPGQAWAHYVLEVLRLGGEPLFAATLEEGEGWCVHWNHSVAGFLVRDCYRVTGGHMVLERAHQPDFAAGLGHIPGRGTVTAAPEGGYWINDIDEPIAGDCLRMRLGSARVDHRIVLKGAEHSLSALAAREAVRVLLRPAGSEGEPRC